LKACRFFELPKGELWVSTDLRVAFSYEVIHDHDTQWLNQRLADRPPASEFWFYFNVSPENADRKCQEILAEVGLPALRPVLRLVSPVESKNSGTISRGLR
jgi:hypothetical protein